MAEAVLVQLCKKWRQMVNKALILEEWSAARLLVKSRRSVASPPPADAGAQAAAGEPAEDQVGDVEEEARVLRVRHDPEKPTARERLEHNCTYCPYRSWRRHLCARERGLDTSSLEV